MTSIPRRAALVAGLALVPAARAQGAPVRIVVPFPPGGAADLTARLLAQHMAGPLQRTLVVENRPGANGILGAEVVARAVPDGSTLLLAPREIFGVNPVLHAPLPYDGLSAFAPIGIATTGPYVLAVNPGLGVTDLAGLVALARRRELTYGSFGIGSMGHLNVEAFARAAGIRLIHVPYRGAGPAATATVSGEVAMTLSTPPAVAGLVQDGRLRALVVGSPVRLARFPDVPTIAEAGYPADTMVPGYFALAAPAGTPASTVARINAAMRDALAVPELVARLETVGLEPSPGTPAEMANIIAADTQRFGALIRATGIRRE